MDLCLAWLYNCRLLYLHHWKNRSYIPHLFPRCLQSQFWDLGSSVARVQSCSDGMHLVWCPSLDWWRMCPSHDLCYRKCNSRISQRSIHLLNRHVSGLASKISLTVFLTLGLLQETSSRSSYFGSALFRPFGSLCTRSAICSLSKPTLFRQQVSVSSSGQSFVLRALDQSSTRLEAPTALSLLGEW